MVVGGVVRRAARPSRSLDPLANPSKRIPPQRLDDRAASTAKEVTCASDHELTSLPYDVRPLGVGHASPPPGRTTAPPARPLAVIARSLIQKDTLPPACLCPTDDDLSARRIFISSPFRLLLRRRDHQEDLHTAAAAARRRVCLDCFWRTRQPFRCPGTHDPRPLPPSVTSAGPIIPFPLRQPPSFQHASFAADLTRAASKDDDDGRLLPMPAIRSSARAECRVALELRSRAPAIAFSYRSG